MPKMLILLEDEKKNTIPLNGKVGRTGSKNDLQGILNQFEFRLSAVVVPVECSFLVADVRRSVHEGWAVSRGVWLSVSTAVHVMASVE